MRWRAFLHLVVSRRPFSGVSSPPDAPRRSIGIACIQSDLACRRSINRADAYANATLTPTLGPYDHVKNESLVHRVGIAAQKRPEARTDEDIDVILLATREVMRAIACLLPVCFCSVDPISLKCARGLCIAPVASGTDSK